MMAMMTPAGSLAGAPRGSQADVADDIVSKMWESIRIVHQMEAELRALTIGQARAPEGLMSELRQARADYWEVQAALTEIKLLVPLDESTDGPKAGWAGVVERVRCFTQCARREAEAWGEVRRIAVELATLESRRGFAARDSRQTLKARLAKAAIAAARAAEPAEEPR